MLSEDQENAIARLVQRIDDLGKAMRVTHGWEAEEDATLRRMWRTHTQAAIALKLGRDRHSVAARAKQLNLTHNGDRHAA